MFISRTWFLVDLCIFKNFNMLLICFSKSGILDPSKIETKEYWGYWAENPQVSNKEATDNQLLDRCPNKPITVVRNVALISVALFFYICEGASKWKHSSTL